MPNGTLLSAGSWLEVASPPNRNAVSGLTLTMWVRLATPLPQSYHTPWCYLYPGPQGSTEGFEFAQATSTQATAFLFCNAGNPGGGFENIGTTTYDAYTWYFLAEVYTNVAGTVTRRTYISATAGANPTLIAEKTWTCNENPDTPSTLYIGYWPGQWRDLVGSVEYVGVFETALSVAQLAAQSNSPDPIVASWLFIDAELGVIADSSGNGRSITVVGSPVEASGGGAPLVTAVSAAVTALSGGPTASIAASVEEPSGVVATVTALSGGPTASIDASVEEPSGVVATVTALSGGPTASIDAYIPPTEGRVIMYGHSIIAGYTLADPNEHVAHQLELLLGNAVDQVVELGYPGETAAQLDTNFYSRVSGWVQPGQETVLVFLGAYNSVLAGNVTAQDIANSVWSICTKAHNLGCTIVLMDEFAGGTAAYTDAVAVAYNFILASQWTAHADGFVRIRRTFYDWNDLTLYDDDTVHFNANGHHVLAELNLGEVSRLLAGGEAQATALVASAGGGLVDALVTLAEPDEIVSVVAAGAGGPASSVAASVGLDARVVALAGGPTAAASVLVGTPKVCAVAAVAGGPTSGIVAWLVNPAATGGGAAIDRSMARRSLLVPAGVTVRLPQWGRSLRVISGAVVFVRFDGSQFGDPLTSEHRRPALAVSVFGVQDAVVEVRA